MANKAIDQDKHWQYNKNFINWVVDVTKKSVEEGGLADDAIQHLKNRSLETIINLKAGAKVYKHRAEHMLDAIRIIRGLS